MIDLAKKALERLQSGGAPSEKSEGAPTPLKDAMKEAFEAAQSGDFDRYFTAFESALDIRLAEVGSSEGSTDAEPWELDELRRQ